MAGVYQLFCMLFLTAMVTPLLGVAKLRMYAYSGLTTLIIAGIASGSWWILVTVVSLTPLQATSIAGMVILGSLAALAYVQHNVPHSAQEV